MSVTARVVLTVEIDVPDHWGDDCTFGQIQKQAIEAARGALRCGVVLDGVRGLPVQATTMARVVGEPNVIQIMRTKAGSK